VTKERIGTREKKEKINERPKKIPPGKISECIFNGQ
jgi:hypothetical protein